MPHSDTARQRATTLLLLVLACGAAAFIVMVEWRKPAPPPATGRPAPALSIEAEKIDYIAIQNAGMIAELALQQGVWMITAPLKTRADRGRVNRILTAIENLPCLETVTEAQRQARAVSLADYGLATPVARLVLGAGQRRQSTLDVGDLSPLRDAVYARVDLHPDIIATTTNLIQMLPRALEDLRDTRLADGNPNAISRLEIKSAQAPLIKITREGGEWIIQRPITARADRLKVMQMLEQIFDLRIAQFVSETMADPVAYGLSDDEAVLQLGLWAGAPDQSQKIVFGKAVAGGALLFAAHAGANSVYAVPRAAVEALPTGLAALRDARLYCMASEKATFIALEAGDQTLCLQKTNDLWQITAPIQWKANPRAVSDLLHHLNALRIEDFTPRAAVPEDALEKPSFIIRLAETPPPADGATPKIDAGAGTPPAERPGARVLRISARRPEIGGGVYARFDDDQQFVQLSAAALSAISADPADYRDPTVLALEPRNVRMLACAANGAARTVERDAEGAWRDTAPGAPPPPADIIKRLLAAAGDLRAVRFERGITAPDLALYGLREPRFTIAFTLTGTEGIRKTILGGQAAEDQGVFAMIQGQTAIFVLDNEIAGWCMKFIAGTP